jgi:hypothetical protein
VFVGAETDSFETLAASCSANNDRVERRFNTERGHDPVVDVREEAGRADPTAVRRVPVQTVNGCCGILRWEHGAHLRVLVFLIVPPATATASSPTDTPAAQAAGGTSSVEDV